MLLIKTMWSRWYQWNFLSVRWKTMTEDRRHRFSCYTDTQYGTNLLQSIFVIAFIHKKVCTWLIAPSCNLVAYQIKISATLIHFLVYPTKKILTAQLVNATRNGEAHPYAHLTGHSVWFFSAKQSKHEKIVLIIVLFTQFCLRFFWICTFDAPLPLLIDEETTYFSSKTAVVF